MKWLLTIAFAGLCAVQTSATAQTSHLYTIEGLKTNFTMQVLQKGWVGGNFYQLSERLDAPIFGKPAVVKIFDYLKDEARHLDAVLLYIIDPGDIVPCIIRVVPAEPAMGTTAEDFTLDWAYGFARELQKRDPPGSVAELKYYMGSEKHSVGGFPAVRMLIEFTNPSGGRYVHVQDFVVLGQNIQVFFLRCDKRLSKARVPEYEAMLRTVRYR